GGSDEPERVRGARVTASLMPLLGIAPSIGRAFTPEEDVDAAPAVAILADGLWRRRYGSDPAIVGRTIQVDGTPRTVVGILPRGATANAATLLVARASNRRTELVVRAALGATRARLLSLSVAECVVFASIGGLAGLVLGSWTLRTLVPLFAASLPRTASVDV